MKFQWVGGRDLDLSLGVQDLHCHSRSELAMDRSLGDVDFFLRQVPPV